MRRALAIALTSLAVPATAVAAEKPFHNEALTPSPELDKALMTHERAKRGREPREQKVAIPAHLAAIAACESGMNPQAVSADGQYHGLFQFSVQTWHAIGGEGDPAAASVAEQVKRAEILYAQSGPGQWPVCGS